MKREWVQHSGLNKLGKFHQRHPCWGDIVVGGSLVSTMSFFMVGHWRKPMQLVEELGWVFFMKEHEIGHWSIF